MRDIVQSGKGSDIVASAFSITQQLVNKRRARAEQPAVALRDVNFTGMLGAPLSADAAVSLLCKLLEGVGARQQNEPVY